MPATATTMMPPEGEVTFRGRGLGVIRERRLALLVCPLCSQRNAPRAADKGICQWCAYEPSLRDVQPARAE